MTGEWPVISCPVTVRLVTGWLVTGWLVSGWSVTGWPVTGGLNAWSDSVPRAATLMGPAPSSIAMRGGAPINSTAVRHVWLGLFCLLWFLLFSSLCHYCVLVAYRRLYSWDCNMLFVSLYMYIIINRLSILCCSKGHNFRSCNTEVTLDALTVVIISSGPSGYSSLSWFDFCYVCGCVWWPYCRGVPQMQSNECLVSCWFNVFIRDFYVSFNMAKCLVCLFSDVTDV